MKKLSYQVLKTLVAFTMLTMLGINSQASTILIFGDSLSAGYGLQEKEDWPHLLKLKLLQKQYAHHKVINASISGETTTGGRDRFIKTFKKHKPDIVFLELGANDGLRGQSLKKMRKNLNHIIQYSLKHKATLILAGMRIPPNYGKRYTKAFHQVFLQLNERHNITFIPFLLESLVDDETLFQNDGVHPTAKAQPLLLEQVWKTIKPLLQTPTETVTLRN